MENTQTNINENTSETQIGNMNYIESKAKEIFNPQMIINNSTITDIVELLFENMKDSTDNLDSLSRKTIIELSQTNMEIVIKVGVDSIGSILKNSSNSVIINDWLESYTDLLQEIIDKQQKYLNENCNKVLYTFLVETVKIYIDTKPAKSGKELENFKTLETRTLIITRLLIKLAGICFKEVLNEILTLFTPGNIPHKYVIELLIELTVPYTLKIAYHYSEVLSRILPILSSIKEENQRVLICRLISSICESVFFSIESEGQLDIESNENDSRSQNNFIEIKEVTNPLLKSSLDSLYTLFGTAYDLIQAQWLINCVKYSNKVSIIKSIILLGGLLPETSLPNQIDKIIDIFVNNIKKECFDESLMLSKSLRMYIELIISKNKLKVESNLNSLLVNLFPIITSIHMSPNVKDFNPNFAKLKSELMRVYLILLVNFTDKVFTFLVSRFDVNSTIDKLSNVYLIKTLLIKIHTISDTHRDMLLAALTKATHENDFEYKYSLIELSHVLFEEKLLTNDNASKLISFLIKETGYSDLAISKIIDNPSYPFITTIKNLRDKAEYVLFEIITKVENSEKFFWPNILEYIVDSNCKESQYIICRIILGCKVVHENKMIPFTLDIESNKNMSNNLPNASQILIKLFIILSDPLKRTGLPFIAINVVKVLFPLLHKDLKDSNPDLSELENYLKRGKYFDENNYLDLLTNTWERILTDLKNTDLLNTLTESMSEFINSHIKETLVVSFIIRLFGLVLSQVNKREVIKNHLNSIFSICHPEFKHDVINGNINSTVPSSVLRISVAEAFGLTGKSHLDIVLDKINAIFNSEIQYSKPTGFSSLFSSSAKPTLSIQIRTTLILALGRIAKHAKPDLLSSRVNSNFLSNIGNLYKEENIPFPLKFAAIQSLGCIFKALHKLSSSYIDSSDVFILQTRDSFLTSMISIFKQEKKLNEIKVESLLNISYLIQLDPPLSKERCQEFVRFAFSIYEYKEMINYNEMTNKALEASNNILSAVLIHETHFSSIIDNIEDEKNKNGKDNKENKNNKEVTGITRTLETMISYKKETFSSWDMFSYILEEFLNMFIHYSSPEMKSLIFDQIESFVNKKKSVKFNNKEEFQTWSVSLLSLLYILFSEVKEVDREGVLLCIGRLLTGVNVFNISMGLSNNEIIKELVTVFTSLERLELLFITQKLFHLMKAKNTEVCENASKLIEMLISSKPEDYKIDTCKDKSLKSEVEMILTLIIETLDSYNSKDDKSFVQVLRIAEVYSDYNLLSIVDACMNEKYSLPLPLSLTNILQKISKDDNKLKKIFTKVTDILNNEDPGSENKPNHLVCASTIILGTILQDQPNPSSKAYDKISKFFPQLLSTLILRIGSAHSINYTIDSFPNKESDPRNQTIWAMQQLVKYSQYEQISACLMDGGSIQSKLLETYEYDEGIYELMIICCQRLDHKSQKLMFDFMEEFLDRPWNGQRVVAVASMAQFVYFASEIHCKVDGFDIDEWRSSLIEKLSSYNIITDSDDMVRKMAIRGLSNLTKVYLESINEIDEYIKLTENKNEGKFK